MEFAISCKIKFHPKQSESHRIQNYSYITYTWWSELLKAEDEETHVCTIFLRIQARLVLLNGKQEKQEKQDFTCFMAFLANSSTQDFE